MSIPAYVIFSRLSEGTASIKDCITRLKLTSDEVKFAFDTLVKGCNNKKANNTFLEGVIRRQGRGYQLERIIEEETVDNSIERMEESETTQSIFTSTPPHVDKKRHLSESYNRSELDQTRLQFPDQV
jgi:hypothetical protein